MLGLGEEEEEVFQTMRDLRDVNVDVVTIGQYLQPSKNIYQLKNSSHQINLLSMKIRLGIRFRHVESGPLVRSSYKAAKHIL
jgi:lipoic acid synthetase